MGYGVGGVLLIEGPPLHSFSQTTTDVRFPTANCQLSQQFLDDDREVLGSLLLSLNSYIPAQSPLQLPPHDLAPPVAAVAAAATGPLDSVTNGPATLAATAAAAAATAATAAGPRKAFGIMTPTIGVDALKRRELLRNQVCPRGFNGLSSAIVRNLKLVASPSQQLTYIFLHSLHRLLLLRVGSVFIPFLPLSPAKPLPPPAPPPPPPPRFRVRSGVGGRLPHPGDVPAGDTVHRGLAARVGGLPRVHSVG